MIKKLGKAIRRNLLKVDWIRLEVEARQLVEKKRRHHERWAEIMHAGRAVRELEPTKLHPYQTLAIVTDDGLVEEYINGRVVGQGFIDSVQWGGMRI